MVLFTLLVRLNVKPKYQNIETGAISHWRCLRKTIHLKMEHVVFRRTYLYLLARSQIKKNKNNAVKVYKLNWFAPFDNFRIADVAPVWFWILFVIIRGITNRVAFVVIYLIFHFISIDFVICTSCWLICAA